MNYFELKLKLKSIYDRFEYNELTSKQIANKFNLAIPFSECKVSTVPSLSLSGLNFEVTGCYNPELDQEGKKPIEIEILLPKERLYYIFSNDDLSRDIWYSLVFDIVTVLGHEYVHLHQFRRRHFKPGKEYSSKEKCSIKKERQEYLGIPDEVDAYAFTAAAQMAYALPLQIDFKSTPVYEWYKSAFKRNDPILKTLENKSNRYFKKLKRQYNETNK
jgi:hypothetical protein